MLCTSAFKYIALWPLFPTIPKSPHECWKHKNNSRAFTLAPSFGQALRIAERSAQLCRHTSGLLSKLIHQYLLNHHILRYCLGWSRLVKKKLQTIVFDKLSFDTARTKRVCTYVSPACRRHCNLGVEAHLKWVLLSSVAHKYIHRQGEGWLAKLMLLHVQLSTYECAT